MRVLLISHTCQSATAGQPKAVELARLGVELCVLVPDRWRDYGRWRTPDEPASPPYRFVKGRVMWPWAGPAQFYLHWYPGLGRLLRDFRPDILDLWEEPWGLVSAHACRLRGRIAPWCKIVSETEQNIDKTLPPPFEGFRSYTLKSADFVIGRNREAIEIVRRKGYRGPAQVVPNAVDPELFRPMDRAACREQFGIHGFTAGYAGRLVEEKGLDDFLEALALCRGELNAVIVGDGPHRDHLVRRAQELGLDSRARFLPAVPFTDLPAFMNAIDVFVLPSRTTRRWKEQFGRVIIEAHACGTPVIGSDSGAIPEVLGDGGWIIPERNPSALALALEEARASGLPQVRREEITHRAREHFSWKAVARKYAGIYSGLTNGRSDHHNA
ncbi:MAG: glycosyl transferase family 1 [Armatimonadota bacterium]|nr:MAG: glycosyl transferase family 1 [Armatimonadota bacterium]